MWAWYIPAVLALGLLIIVHEGGHFIVARLCKMRVERFSLFFGPPILKFTRGDTTYQIGPIPLGGFVQIAGMNPHDEVSPDDPKAYPNRPAWQRFLTIFAGPGTNYVFASILWFVLIVIAGAPLPKVEDVEPGMAAAQAGLERGDVVVAVGHERLSFENFDNFRDMINQSNGQPITLTVRRPARHLAIELAALPPGPLDLTRALGMPRANLLRSIVAAVGDLRPGDSMKTSDGRMVPYEDPIRLEQFIDAQKTAITVTIDRPGREFPVTLRPTYDHKNGRYRIGVALGGGSDRVMPTAFGAVKSAIFYPVVQSGKIFAGLWRVVTRQEKGEVGGPVAITRVIQEQFRSGWVQVVEVLAILNVYLGLFNLLPLPALDGGRLVFLGYEMITRRRPNPRIEAAVHTVGFLVLLGLMLVVTYKDIFG